MCLYEETDAQSYQIGMVYKVIVNADKKSFKADGSDKVSISIEVSKYNGPLDVSFNISVFINDAKYDVSVTPEISTVYIEFKATAAGVYKISANDARMEVILITDELVGTGTNMDTQSYEAMQKQLSEQNQTMSDFMDFVFQNTPV